MNCNICGTNEATIHLTEIINNQMVEIHLCEPCAQEKGTDFKTHFNFGDLLAGLSDADLDSPQSAGTKRSTAECSSCHITYDEFAQAGRLGCPDCYNSFTKMLVPLIRRVQRSAQHLGKRPARSKKGTKQETSLGLLQDRLRKCVEKEAFEEAAQLRDEIKQMEQGKPKRGKKK